MPTFESDSPRGIRKSSRSKKGNTSLVNDLPADIVRSMGGDHDVKMPPGYNPSDDSEDDYKPSSVSKKTKRDESDVDSDEGDRIKKSKKQRRSTPGRTSSRRKPAAVTPKLSSGVKSPNLTQSSVLAPTPTASPLLKVKSETGKKDEEETITCIWCKEVVTLSNNARFHYSVHFYAENAFLSFIKPEDLKNGKAQDESGKIFKYTCPYEGCTKRKMGYKEICVHLSTAHQILKQLMMKDKRPGMKEAAEKFYPPVEPLSPLLKVKQEKVSSDSVPLAPQRTEVYDNSEDVDDPGEPAATSPALNKVTASIPVNGMKTRQQDLPKTSWVKSERRMVGPMADKIHHCVLCNGPGKMNKEGRNLNLGTGLHDLKYHYAVCLYDEGGLVAYMDHGQGEGKQMKDLEEFGTKFKYKCPFIDCERNQGRTRPIGYKEYAIHCAVWHHQIERWMFAERERRPGLKEVYDAVVSAREKDGVKLEEMPEVIVEEMHICLLCQGEDKDGRNLSFEGARLFSLRYHYAACYYEEGVYLTKYSPGPNNMTEEGQPKDELGMEVKYKCQERGCTVKRNMGYKEYAIHMSNEHGGLEEVIKQDRRPEIRDLFDKIKKTMPNHK